MAYQVLTERTEEGFRFLDGWFTRVFASGERPEYGYSKNRLPETSLDSMEVITGFMANVALVPSWPL